MNRLVTGLGKEHFRVTEDKVPQEITQFGAEDAPLSLGIVFDASGSMGRKLSKAREAVARFSKTANPDDEFFLVLFKDRPELAVDFTRAIGEIQNRLIFAQSKGRTALLDAIYLAINKMGSSGFLVDVRPTAAPSCSFCGPASTIALSSLAADRASAIS